jgi:hypothetical protein
MLAFGDFTCPARPVTLHYCALRGMKSQAELRRWHFRERQRERRLAGQTRWCFGSDGWSLPHERCLAGRVPGAGDEWTPSKICFEIPIHLSGGLLPRSPLTNLPYTVLRRLSSPVASAGTLYPEIVNLETGWPSFSMERKLQRGSVVGKRKAWIYPKDGVSLERAVEALRALTQ